MYCSNCGTKAQGKFCWRCGVPLTAHGDALAPPYEPAPFDLAAAARTPEARELVARYAALAQKRMSGEEFLKAFDKPLAALTGVPVSPIATVSQMVGARLGVKTGKERVERIDRPARDAFLALLCSLARNGQLLRALHPGTDGCLVEAELPSDMWSFAGTILVTVRRADPGTEVRASTAITGRLFRGKSNACLDTLLTDMRNIPVLV